MLIDPFQENWLRWLDAVHANLAPEEHLYLLIDGAFVPGLHQVAYASESPASRLVLLFKTQSHCSKEVADVSPFLLSYAPESASLHRALAGCNGMPMVSAIVTSEALIPLAQRLAAWCIVKVDDQNFNFRYPDTRRLPGIFQVLTPEQKSELIGPASAWHFIARDGNWKSLPVPCEMHPPAESPKLDDAQFAAILEDCEADEVLLLLKDRGRLWEQPHARLHGIAQAALQIARQKGMETVLRLDWCESFIDTTLAAHNETASHA